MFQAAAAAVATQIRKTFSGEPSKPSRKKPAGPRPAQNSTPSLPHTPPAPKPASDYGTKAQVQAWKAEAQEHHRQSAQGVQASIQTRDMMEHMLGPRDNESPTQLQEIGDMLKTIAEAVARIEREQQRLSAVMLRPRGYAPILAELARIESERAKAPRQRDPDAEGKAARTALWTLHEQAMTELRKEREAFENMPKPRGWRLFNEAAYASHGEARDRLQMAQARYDETNPSLFALDNAERSARFYALAEQGERTRWEAGPGARLVRQEAPLLAIRDALDAGDKDMMRAASKGLNEALELQRKRDGRERREREWAANVLTLRQEQNQELGLPAPRMR